MSRSIGDKHLKRWVIAEPETRVLRIASDHEFMILASDGLWDKVRFSQHLYIDLGLLFLGLSWY